jgi:hypothetical protein
MIQIRGTSRNVKRWQSGDMCLRWTAASMLEAEQQFRKVIGYRRPSATPRIASWLRPVAQRTTAPAMPYAASTADVTPNEIRTCR